MITNQFKIKKMKKKNLKKEMLKIFSKMIMIFLIILLMYEKYDIFLEKLGQTYAPIVFIVGFITCLFAMGYIADKGEKIIKKKT